MNFENETCFSDFLKVYGDNKDLLKNRIENEYNKKFMKKVLEEKTVRKKIINKNY
jgi:hypothetical protein